MRASNRTALLEAAVRIVEAGGMTAVTLDSVAAETGITKGGLMYHFPTREALLSGVHEHLTARWEAQLEAEVGGAPANATAEERLRAYVNISAQTATIAELMMLMEATLTTHDRPWLDVLDRWTVPIEEALKTKPIGHVLARLAADGLWAQSALGGKQLSDEARTTIARHIIEMIDNADAGDAKT